MKKELSEFINTIEGLCIAYFRKDRIENFDTDESFTQDLYLTASVRVCEELSTFSWYEEDYEEITSPRSTYSVGCIKFKTFKVKIIVDVYAHWSSRYIFISKPYEHTTNKFVKENNGYEIPEEKFNMLFQ